MNSTNLRRVVAVDRHGSITAAAKTLNVTQSAVTKSVANIEQTIGYALFDRRARDVVATPKGREFLDRAGCVVAELDHLREDVMNARNLNLGVLRVGLSPVSLQGLLNQALKAFIVQNRDVRIHVHAAAIEPSIRNLRRGDLDVLIAPQVALKGRADLFRFAIGSATAQLFVRKRHPLASTKASMEDLKNYPIISPDRVGLYAERLRALYGAHGGGAGRNLHVIEYFPIIADLVAGTDAIGVVSSKYAASKSFQRRFSTLDIDFFDGYPIEIAYRKNWTPTKAGRAFIDLLKELQSFGD